MLTSLESRLWLAVHLLYPNSSQAFDVYQAIVAQSESALTQNDRNYIFSKLAQIFDKIPAISSNLSFYEFELEQIDQWKMIYKNSQKVQLIIFVGVLIFEIKIGEIAKQIKLTQEKSQFLFHQTFKKLAQNMAKVKYNEQVNFKKQNDSKISYLYTYENLIEYCLQQLPAEENEKVKQGLELYPSLQTTREEYLKIISQIQNLKIQKSNSVSTKSKTKLTLLTENKATDLATENKSLFDGYFKIGFLKKKIAIGLTFGLIILMTGVFFKLSGVFSGLQRTDGELIIQQIEQKPHIISKDEIALESLPKALPQAEAVAAVQVSADKSSSDVSPSVAQAEAPAQANIPQVVPAEKITAVQEAKAEGGLYRGTLEVQELGVANREVLKKLTALGAKKAGEVELGWMKSNNMAYYHFILIEDNIEKAREYLKSLGTLNIKFEKHPRLISAGSKRFIIEVKGN